MMGLNTRNFCGGTSVRNDGLIRKLNQFFRGDCIVPMFEVANLLKREDYIKAFLCFYNVAMFFAANKVLARSIATVMGPTPPGTGVI